MVELSAGQEKALDKIGRWLVEKPKQVFVLDGPAGSGKTTIVKRIIPNVKGRVVCAGPTGKSALRLKQLGYPDPRTLHKWLFNPKDRSRERVRELEEKLQEALRRKPPVPGPALDCIRRELAQAEKQANSPLFEEKTESDIDGAALVIVDECSLIGKQVALALLAKNIPVLCMGDSAQLPPVGDVGFFTRRAPDAQLTEVHRQARDNPVLRLATDLRERRMPAYGEYGDSRVVDKLSMKEAMGHDQVIVGRNHTRREKNKQMRQILGFKSTYPEIGDRIICRRNEHSLGLLNGSTWRVIEVGPRLDDEVPMTLKCDDGYEDTEIAVRMHAHPFRGEDIPYALERLSSKGDYGYAITAHVAQGSEWDSVLVNVEPVHNCDLFAWCYTAVSRARDRVTIKVR